MPEQVVWSLPQLLDEHLGQTVVWATPSVRQMVTETLPWRVVDPSEPLPQDLQTLVVVGGGTLIDHAKLTRRSEASQVRLVAIPSLWGSGAEASPIVVTTLSDCKDIQVDAAFLPDVRVTWPELAQSVPEPLARWACGDTWSHAIEGFLSPLASDALRDELAETIREMAQLPIGYDPRWFTLSARACAAQAQSSVGLIHGIAHTLEPVLRSGQSNAGWGHARLCSAFLAPTLHLLMSVGDKVQSRTQAHGVDLAALQRAADAVSSNDDYLACLPALSAHWTRVLRDPCTRTNCVLIRSGYISYFTSTREEAT